MIVFIVPYLNKFGGIQTFAKNLQKSLKNYSKIRFLNFKFYYPSDKVKKLYNIYPTLYWFACQLKYRNIFRKINGYGIVHFWQPHCAIGFNRKNYIVSCHGIEILLANLEKFQIYALNRVFARAKFIHFNSQFTKELFCLNFKSIDKSKLKVIYPGVYKNKVKKKKKPKNKFFIGTLSRFEKRKNIVNIIKALEILYKNGFTNFIYYLVGEGKAEKEIKKNLKQVSFKYCYYKKLTEIEKEKFYQSLDLFVLPIKKVDNSVEGFGIVYLEANSWGVPVIGSGVDGTKEAIKFNKSGLISSPSSPEQIADAVLKLLKNKEKFTDSAALWADKFCITKTAKKFIKIYDRFKTKN
jgi:phosphatidyl-myo-inositol dimannoside synthase